jgi:hypothetical protein
MSANGVYVYVVYIKKRNSKVLEYSILPRDAIADPDIRINQVVDVLYNKKPYKARVLRISSEYQFPGRVSVSVRCVYFVSAFFPCFDCIT